MRVLREKKYLSHSIKSFQTWQNWEVKKTLVSRRKVANDFDLDHFRQLMARDGLRFADEQSDVLNPLRHRRGEEMDLV